MVCIYCGANTQVANSRLQKQANNVWRRRHCTACGGTFTTHEQPDLPGSFVVQTSQTDVEPFSRDKLLISIHEACKHRKDALEAATGLTRTVLNKLLPAAHNGTLKPQIIAAVAHGVLARFDATAATVYIAYHPGR